LQWAVKTAHYLITILIMCDAIRRMLEGTRPVDQLMLVIEFLILVFIVWEFGWKVKDWYQERRKTKEYEDEMVKKLSHLAPEEAEAMQDLILRGQQPPDQIALSTQQKIFPILARDHVLGWSIDRDHRDYMKRWAKKNKRQPTQD
jgi:hypothetical protein